MQSAIIILAEQKQRLSIRLKLKRKIISHVPDSLVVYYMEMYFVHIS